MAIIQETKLRWIKHFIAIAWSCLLLTFVLNTDLQAAKPYTITASAGANGSISPSGAVTVYSGENKIFTMSPSLGYHVANVTVDGVSKGAITTYTFTNVTANHTIAATFAINTYAITATAGSGGTMTPATTNVNYGGSQTFTVTPDTGYQVAGVAVDGVSQGAITSYTFTNVTAAHTIAATFSINTYTITATAGSGGTMTPGTTAVAYGGSQDFTIAPTTGYHVAIVLVDGVSQGALTSYTFNNVAATHTIAAIFALDASPPASSSSDYFYDDLGRLARVVQGTSGISYSYDELGNLISTTSATTAGGAPMLTAINPNVLFVGSKMRISITGQNLLTTETVTADGGLVSITGVTVTDSRITAEMTAMSAGTETIKITTRSGATAAINATLTASRLSFSPGQLALAPGSSGTLTATISPSIDVPVTIEIKSNAPSIATAPQSVTIPATGSATFTVDALQLGVATLDAGDPRSVVFVANPFIGDVGDTVLGIGANVSVMIDTPLGASPIGSNSVSVAVDTPYGTAVEAAAPVSVIFDTPSGNSTTVSGGVSVEIQ